MGLREEIKPFADFKKNIATYLTFDVRAYIDTCISSFHMYKCIGANEWYTWSFRLYV